MSRPKQQSTYHSPIFTITLLVKFAIIWIGKIPIVIVKQLILLPIKAFLKLSNLLPTKIRLSLLISTLVLALISYTALTIRISYELPNPHRLSSLGKPQTTIIYDRNNKILYKLYDGPNRTLTNIDDLPLYLQQATIAIEDKNFSHHFGLDLIAVARATYHNLTSRQMEGASTITQQLIKNTILTSEKTYERKLKEVILAFWTERIYSKKEILQMYFNEAPYGGSLVGIEAASQAYFSKNAHDLSLAESSYLAGLPASPTKFSPFGTNPELGKARQKEVLRRMLEDKYITQREADETFSQTLIINPPKNNIQAPHFVMYIKDVLAKEYGARVVSQGGLKVYTTLDLDLQTRVEKIVSDEVSNLQGLNVQNGAALVTDPKTGQVLAMVGSRDYYYPNFGNYNGTLALRQPGSSIKVITYSEAMTRGFSPGNTVLDSPVTFADVWGNSYRPVNYDGIFHGPVSLRTALGSSYNIPAVKILSEVGINNMINLARDMGITTYTDTKRYGLSLTLGAGEVQMIDMMSVYGTLSQMGTKRTPTGILKVTDSEGNILEEYEDNPQGVLKPEVAYLITNILSDNKARTPAFGSNSLLNINGFEIAVKTGTSDSKRDNWTFGYTPNVVVGVWVGNNDNSLMNPRLASGVTGAAPIWNKIMHTLLDGQIPMAFQRPYGVIEATVDGRHDLAVAGNIPKGLVRVRTEPDDKSATGFKTTFSDSFSSFATSSAQAIPKDRVTN